VADGVFDEDDGGVDDEAEVDGAEAHEVGGDVEVAHAEDGDEHGEGDGGGDDEAGAPLEEEEEEDGDDDEAAFDEVGEGGFDGAIDQIAAVVEGIEADARGEGLVELLEAADDAFGDGAAVGALEHHDDAEDGFAAAVAGGGALAEFAAQADAAERAEQDGRAGVGGDGDVFEVGEGGDEADAAEETLLAAALEVAAADVLVIAFEGLDDVADRDAVGDEEGRVEEDLVLFLETAVGVDLDDAFELAEAGFDEPVEERAELHGAVLFAGLGRGLEGELDDFAEAGGDRGEFGGESFGELALGLDEALEGLAAGLGEGVAVLEDDGDLGEAELGDGADVLLVGEAGEGGLDGGGDVLLDFEGREGGGFGVDLDLVIGEVGDGVDGEIEGGVDADADEGEGEGDDEEAVLDAPGEEAINHGRAPTGVRGRGRRF